MKKPLSYCSTILFKANYILFYDIIDLIYKDYRKYDDRVEAKIFVSLDRLVTCSQLIN